MKHRNMLVAAICLITAQSMVSQVYARQATMAKDGWQDETRVTQLLIEGTSAGERVYVQFEKAFNPGACKGNDSQWIRIYGNTEKGKYLVSAILSARATRQVVVPLVHGCDDWGRPILHGLITR